jgi:hypothetical protein
VGSGHNLLELDQKIQDNTWFFIAEAQDNLLNLLFNINFGIIVIFLLFSMKSI